MNDIKDEITPEEREKLEEKLWLLRLTQGLADIGKMSINHVIEVETNKQAKYILRRILKPDVDEEVIKYTVLTSVVDSMKANCKGISLNFVVTPPPESKEGEKSDETTKTPPKPKRRVKETK